MYIPALKLQHDQILEGVEAGAKHWAEKKPIECLNDIRSLLVLLYQHHENEREILFDKLKSLPKMNQGGPFCTYFFEFFANNRPLARAERLVSKRRKTKTQLEIPQNVDRFFKEGSLLSIPIEEHLAAEFVCEELIMTLDSSLPEQREWIAEALIALKDLLLTNHNKEETCLWVAASMALDPPTYEALSKLETLPRAQLRQA